MEFTLTICQKQIHDNFPTLDIKDAGIIDFLGRFSHDCTKKVLGQKIYFWFDYGKISTECPLLRLESEAIRKRVRVMVALGILEPHPGNKGGQVYFAFGENYHLTHRDRKGEGREENPKVEKKRSGRKSQVGREENPKVWQKGRDLNPDNHNNHSNHKNQSSSEPEFEDADGLKIELHDNEIPGSKLIDFIPFEPKKENPIQIPTAPSPSESPARRYDAFDMDVEAHAMKHDYRCFERYARDLSTSLEVANLIMPKALDEFVFDQHANAATYPNRIEFRKHFWNWLPRRNAAKQSMNAPKEGIPTRTAQQSQKANLNHWGANPGGYEEKQAF